MPPDPLAFDGLCPPKLTHETSPPHWKISSYAYALYSTVTTSLPFNYYRDHSTTSLPHYPPWFLYPTCLTTTTIRQLDTMANLVNHNNSNKTGHMDVTMKHFSSSKTWHVWYSYITYSKVAPVNIVYSKTLHSLPMKVTYAKIKDVAHKPSL